MSKICILTDDLSQFLDLSFDGQEHVHIVSIQTRIEGKTSADIDAMKPSELPPARSNLSAPTLTAPSAETFIQVFENLSLKYSDIVAVLSSSGLTKCYNNAVKARDITQGKYRVTVIDSGAVGIGLGILVIEAAKKASAGWDANRIKKHLLGAAESVYSVFCVRNLAYLEELGLIDPAQALVGEFLKVHQLFYLNTGALIPVQKLRNSRHMVESIMEFVSEFDDPRYVAIQQSATGFQTEARTIRERLLLEYEEIEIRETSLSMPLASLFGPQSFGLFLWEIYP